MFDLPMNKAREWAMKTLKEQRATVVASGKAVADVPLSTTTIGKKTEGPVISLSMDAVALIKEDISCEDSEPIDYYVYDLAEGAHPECFSIGKGAQLLTLMI
jgi:hypothetical protein